MSRLAGGALCAAALAVALAAAQPARAADPAIKEVRAAWAACTAWQQQNPDSWVGWRRDFQNGYGDTFEFYDNSLDGTLPSVLVQYIMTDAIAYETDTSCYRADGSLAFIFATMSSPNMAEGGENGATIVREGRIYVSPQGKVLQVLGQITDGNGKKLGGIDDEKLMLARGCSPVDMHLTATAVADHYTSELGDIEGNHPAYTPNLFDWCAVAK